MLQRFPGRQENAKHVGVEVPVEFLFRDRLDRGEPVDAGIVDEHIDQPERASCLGEQALDISGLRNIALDRSGLAAIAGDLRDYLLRAVPARRVIHQDGSACGRQLPRNLGSDSLRSTGDNGNLVRKFAH